MSYIFKGWSPPRTDTTYQKIWRIAVYTLAALGTAVLFVFSVTLITPWRHDVLRLMWRSVSHVIESTGNTYIGVAVALFIFPPLDALWAAIRSGHFRENVVGELKKSLISQPVVTMAILTVLFGWSLARTVHDDHSNLLQRSVSEADAAEKLAKKNTDLNQENARLAIENNTLKSNPTASVAIQSREAQIQKLTSELADKQEVINALRGQIALGDQVAPWQVTSSSRPVETRPNLGKHAVEFIILTNKVIASPSVDIKCQGKIKNYEGTISGESAFMSGGVSGRISEHEVAEGFGSPAWTPTRPFVMTLYFDEDDLGICSATGIK